MDHLAIFVEHLASWELYDKKHIVQCHEITARGGGVYLGYRTGRQCA